jgi:hypothetical protein
MVKGPSSSGKSNVVRAVLSLLPPEMVEERSSLSSKALAYGDMEVNRRVLYLSEQRGGKDSRLLLRLLQSEGSITHEYTVLRGRSRGTEVATKLGKPVVITTTTDERIFVDDETRFLSVWVDASPEQTIAIAKSFVRRKEFNRTARNPGLIREAVRVLLQRDVRIELPKWFESVAIRLPAAIRTRRDFPRFLSLVKAVALVRSMSDKRCNSATIEVNLADYAVAYKLADPAFSMTASRSVDAPEVVKVCRQLYAELKKPITRKQIRKHTHKKEGVTHKYIKAAILAGFLKREPAGANNEQRYTPVKERSHFLPSPKWILKKHPELEGAKYIDPLDGKPRKLRRRERKHAD